MKLYLISSTKTQQKTIFAQTSERISIQKLINESALVSAPTTFHFSFAQKPKKEPEVDSIWNYNLIAIQALMHKEKQKSRPRAETFTRKEKK